MSRKWDDPRWERKERVREARRSQRKRRRSRRRSRELTPEELAYREAQRAAERKVRFVQHLIIYGIVCVFILIVAGRFPAMVTALAWGIYLALQFFQSVIAPDLRRKWVSSEVDRQVARSVSAERRVLEADKLRSLEELSASIAHEIRNPITAAKSLVQQMGEDPGSNENVEYAQVALDELDRVERSISHLLRYAREEDMVVGPMDLADVAASAVEAVRERAEAAGVGLVAEFDEQGQIQGDAEKLRRVFINLIGNAIDAFEEADTADPKIVISVGDNLAGTDSWVRVKDNGPGIDPETLSKIFRPFFTSKANGTGLGLAITKKLVDAHTGEIRVESQPGKGTEFEIVFPKVHNSEGASR